MFAWSVTPTVAGLLLVSSLSSMSAQTCDCSSISDPNERVKCMVRCRGFGDGDGHGHVPPLLGAPPAAATVPSLAPPPPELPAGGSVGGPRSRPPALAPVRPE